MKVGIVGLGKMGYAIAVRLIKSGYTVFGFDTDQALCDQFAIIGGVPVSSIELLCNHVTIIWLMVPVAVVDQVLNQLLPHASKGTVVIDGGNSYYKDSIARARSSTEHNVIFMDCGTSGGIHGQEHGFCLMVGGAYDTYIALIRLFESIAAHNGVAYVGNSGAGHYVKMIHNGIEYGILQAYAEGFHLLKEGAFGDQLNLAQIARLWNHGSVIRSFILQLSQQVLEKDQSFNTVSGSVQELGTGKWALEEAREFKIPTPVLDQSLQVRAWSRSTGGNFATKFIALLRNAFGGHAVMHKE